MNSLSQKSRNTGICVKRGWKSRRTAFCLHSQNILKRMFLSGTQWELASLYLCRMCQLQSEKKLQYVRIPVLSGSSGGSIGSSLFKCKYSFCLPSGAGRMSCGIQRFCFSGNVYRIPKRQKNNLSGLPLHGAIRYPE